MKNDDSFSKQIDDVLSGKYNRFDALKVCDTPRIFLDAGLQQLPILYTQNHLKDALHEKSADNPHWHGLSIEQIKKVPKLLESPVLLMDSLNNDDSIVAVLSLLDNDNAPVFATIKPNGNGIYNSHKTDSNFMLSIYGKEKGFEYYIKRAVDENKLLYWNKEKSQEIQCAELLMAQGLDSLDSNKILHQTNSLVNKTTSTLVIDSNQAARIKAAREIKENMPNLSENERAAAVAILEAGAKSQKMSISEYMEKTFPNGIFGDIKKAENAAKQQGVEINGAVSINGFGENAKAVIYAGKTADFSTWCHELSHVWQSQLTGELKQNAEEAFQVKNSDWQNSVYTFEDGHTDTSAEAFAYGFEDFLKHKAGEMSTEEKKKIFEKFADYMSRTYNGVKQHIKINEKITAVYQKLIDLDDNILAQAEKAVREESENEFLQREKNIQHSERREDYIKKYYTNIKNQYYETEQISSDGKRKGIIEVSNDRNLNNKTTRTEIDALLTFTDMGAYATLLSESPSIGDEKHIDALLNHRTLVEIKSPTGNANSIAKEIKEAINKENSELVTVFLLDSAKNVSDDEILEKLEQKRKFIHGNTDGIFVIRNGIISEIKIPRVESFQTRSPSNSNNITNAKNVNISFQPVDSSTLFQFQIIGELGARELDRNAESNEHIANLKMSDNTEQTETSKTRPEYLQGKTELSDVDIINILDLPVEKRSINNEIYTDKSYKELKNNPEELSSLTENLKTKPEYLKYHSSYIAKSKLLYQDSDVLCNEIPCLIVLDQLKKTSYLLPYEYAANKSGAAITSADALKSNTFTDFKRVFNHNLHHAIEKGAEQGKDIFFLINNEKLDYEETKKQLIKFTNNRTSENKEGTYLFFSEKNFVCYSFESNKDGFVRELSKHDLKEIRAAISSKPLTPSRESEKTSDSLASNLNITQKNSDVNDFKQIRLANIDKPLHPTRSQTEMSATSSDNIDLPQNKSAVNDLKEIRAAISSKPLTPSRESEKTSDSLASNLNITQENSDVNELFSSLLLRGEITLLEKKKDIENRQQRYFAAVKSLEKLNASIHSETIKKSNSKFIEKECSSKFFKSLVNTQRIVSESQKVNNTYVKKSGLAPLDKPSFAETIPNKINIPSTKETIKPESNTVNKLYKKNKALLSDTADIAPQDQIVMFDGSTSESRDIENTNEEKNMPVSTEKDFTNKNETENQNIEPSKTEFSNYDSQEYQQKKLATQMILDQEDKEQMENISATMKSATKDFMDLNATPITEERIDFLKTPTGNKSELSENEWKFSHSSEFKELYGDWEGKIKKDFLLNDDTVSKLTGDEFSRKEGFTLTEQVEQYFNETNNSVESPFFGKVVLDREGADDSLSHEKGRLKAVAYAGVPSVIKNGVIIDSDLNHKDRGYNSYVIAAPIKIADKNYICEVVLKQNKQENRFYLHEVTEQKKFLERAFVTNPAQKPAHQGTLSNILEKTVSVNYEISCPMGINGEPEKTFVQNEYRKSLDEFQSKNQNTATKITDSVKQEENPSVQMEPRLMKKFDEMKKAIEDREKQEGQTAAEKTESAGSKKAESHEKPKVDLIKKAAKDFISAIKNGTAPFLNTTENDFGKILLHPAAIVNASNGLPFSGEAQLLAQIYHQQQKMEGEIVTTFEGAKESGTFIADKPESKKNFVLANKTEQQQKEIIQKTRYFMPEACSEPDKIYAHALQMQRPQKISDYRDLIRHFENIPNGQKEISDLRIRIAHEHLKEIQSRFALKEKRVLTVDEINERKKILQDYFKSLPEKHRESEKSAFENTFGLTLNPEEVFKTNLEGNFKDKKFEDVVKSNEKLTDQANKRLSSFIQNNSMEDKKLSEILHEEYNEQLKEEKSTSKKLKIEAKGITEPETYLGKYLAACSSNAEFVTDEETIKAVQANLVKKLEENYRLEKYGILKEIGQQAQKISNETTSKIAFDKAHSNKNIKEKNIAKEIGPVGMGN